MDPHWQRSSLTLKEIKLNKYDGHFFFFALQGQVQDDGCEGMKDGGGQ